MAQKGTLIVCGDAGAAFCDSMYECVGFVGGNITDLGNDAVIEEPTAADCAFLEATLSRHLGDDHPGPSIAPAPVQEGRRRAAAVELRQARMGNVAGGALASSRQRAAVRPLRRGQAQVPSLCVSTGEG